ncbi:MAG TPA: glycosyltransferase [Usitatibacter sp.]|nr:glycosyltransferase [Usitatibacter sp.]
MPLFFDQLFPVNAQAYPVSTPTVVLTGLLAIIVVVTAAYGLRHLLFSLDRLFGRQRHPYLDVDEAAWPALTVFIAAHNEEKVIAGCMDAILAADYPADRLKIVPVNDRSTDRTGEIIEEYRARYPGRINPFHRNGGTPGKSAALKDALSAANGQIVAIFDADYVPARGLLKQLAAPFFDPEVGAVMGRVVPANVSRNVLTRMLDLERSAGYQVDQQARMNLRLVPQFGGTVGGVRRIAMDAVGGWDASMLTEDTDMTFRLLMQGWKTVYTNRSECHEEVPEEWPVRVRQVKRWARGHNQVLARYGLRFLASPMVRARERIDGLLLLCVFVMPLALLAGWLLAVALYFLGASQVLTAFIPLLALMAYSTLGNFAAFFEIVIAVFLDGNRNRIRLLPFTLLGFFVSMAAICMAVGSALGDRVSGRGLVWDKTLRYRAPAPS